MATTKVCKHCGCELGRMAEGDECTNVGWCALIAARHTSDAETQLIADAVAALHESRAVREDAAMTGRDLFSTAQKERSRIW